MELTDKQRIDRLEKQVERLEQYMIKFAIGIRDILGGKAVEK